MTTHDLASHPYFTPWTDPQSGKVSYILTEKVAALQKSFYFVNTSLSPDGAWLWFEAAHPPAPVKYLAAVCLDPQNPDIRLFPRATISAETPVIDAEGGVYFVMSERSPDIWRLDIEGGLEKIFTLPDDFVQGRLIQRLGTHLTLSADGAHLLFDGKVGNVWYVATVDRRTGQFRVIKEFSRHYNHAQFSPGDPALFCIAQDHWQDPYTGKQNGYDLRIWLMTTDGECFEPAEPTAFHSPARKGNEVCHEWWADDGTLCWIRYQSGCFEMDRETAVIRQVWERPICHAHCDPTRRFWVGDQSPYAWPEPCEVVLFDREIQAESRIVSAMPAPVCPRAAYHIDPHPRFIGDGSRIVYTTTVRGEVDLAVTTLLNDFNRS